MAKASGSDRRDFPKGGGLTEVDIKNPRDFATIKDNAVYREMKSYLIGSICVIPKGLLRCEGKVVMVA